MCKISAQYVKVCRRKVRKMGGPTETRTDGRTESRTDGDPDGHHHTIIRPVWRRAYKNPWKSEHPTRVVQIPLNFFWIFYWFWGFVVWQISGHFWGVYQSHYCASDGTFLFSFVYVSKYCFLCVWKANKAKVVFLWMIFIFVHLNRLGLHECRTMILNNQSVENKPCWPRDEKHNRKQHFCFLLVYECGMPAGDAYLAPSHFGLANILIDETSLFQICHVFWNLEYPLVLIFYLTMHSIQ